VGRKSSEGMEKMATDKKMEGVSISEEGVATQNKKKGGMV